jgi:predicted DsbA family dithiol-disulfide isomerase
MDTGRSARGVIGSTAGRWAGWVVPMLDSPTDLRTVGAWARFVGVSPATIGEICRLLEVQPHDARDLGRMLRALTFAHRSRLHLEGVLDVSDRRTLQNCGKFARETLPALEKQYVDTGKVRLAFRQFPLPIHQFAEKAAEAAECAGREGKFWPFHDLLFAQQDSLDVASLQDRAKRVGLESGTFAKCLDGETAAIVQADKSGGEPLGVSGTPTFLVGPILADGTVHVSQRFSGALPLAQFQAALDRFVNPPTAAPVGGQD